MEPCWRSDGGFLTHFFLSLSLRFLFHQLFNNLYVITVHGSQFGFGFSDFRLSQKHPKWQQQQQQHRMSAFISFHVIDSIFYKRPNSFDFDPAEWICHIFLSFQNWDRLNGKAEKAMKRIEHIFVCFHIGRLTDSWQTIIVKTKSNDFLSSFHQK